MAQVQRTLTGMGLRLEGLEYKYNPNQPRRPRGTPIGGQWMSSGGAKFGPTPEEMGRAMTAGAENIDRFLADHSTEITRALGALQMVFGVAEVIGGIGTMVGGGATSEVGVGIPIMLAGAWVVNNGYQNTEAGWRALLTGQPQETTLHRALRDLGLSDRDADNVELALGLSAGGAIAKAGRSRETRAPPAGRPALRSETGA